MNIVIGVMVLANSFLDIRRVQKNFDGPEVQRVKAKVPMAKQIYPFVLVLTCAMILAEAVAGIVVLRKGI